MPSTPPEYKADDYDEAEAREDDGAALSPAPATGLSRSASVMTTATSATLATSASELSLRSESSFGGTSSTQFPPSVSSPGMSSPGARSKNSRASHQPSGSDPRRFLAFIVTHISEKI